MENNKRKIKILVASIIVVMILLVGISYAYFSSRVVSSEQTVTTGNVGLAFDDSTPIVNASNIEPILESEVLTSNKVAKKTFKITNTTDQSSYIDIKLEVISLEDALKSDDFLWSIYETSENGEIGNLERTKLGSDSFLNAENNDEITLIDNIVFGAKEIKTYELYIWIKENNQDQNMMKLKTFKSRIIAEAKQVNTTNEGFEFNSETGAITGYTGTERSISIPSTIDGVNITSIGEDAFYDSKLTSVVIPEGVTSIGEGAFKTNQLTNVVIPSSVTSIGKAAFNNNLLTEESAFIYKRNEDGTIDTTTIVSYGGTNKNITIPSGVTTIEESAFAWNGLTSVTIPDSVTSIGADSFKFNDLTNITIPNSVTYIGPIAFASNRLTNVTIPSSVTSIEYLTFSGNQLTSVTIPDSVTFIGNYAFQENQLTNITIPSSVTSIEYGAFNTNLLPEESAFIYKRNTDGTIDTTTIVSYGGANKDITIPSGVTTIYRDSFRENELTSVIIPNSVTSIGRGAFINNQLTNVTIPSSVTSIGMSAFEYNPNLTQITVEKLESECTGFDRWYDSSVTTVTYKQQ